MDGETIKNIFIGVILGGAIVVYFYETFFERKQMAISRLFAPKIENLIEESSARIAKKQKELKRELTDEEKNKILDECYFEM